jgi:drug/metabolite transporter (DMT)-like permease
MIATMVVYLLWGFAIAIASSTTVAALRNEHPLSSVK